jgi:Carboxypeptidase regulatory-like domain
MTFSWVLSGWFLTLLSGLALLLVGYIFRRRKRQESTWFGTVGLAVVILSAVVIAYTMTRPDAQRLDRAIAGRVVDDATEASLSDARVSLAGRTENTVSESNGNFRLELSSPIHSVILTVEKPGYKTYVQTISPGTHDLPVRLKKVG